MQLTLENFCCWEKKTFTFQDHGATLISAPSGAGKTSILRAILFVLFNIGTKLVHYGKKKCSVTMQLETYTITRTKNPCRVIVQTDTCMYEDDAADAWIRDRFNEPPPVNFTLMNPSEKMYLFEKILFDTTRVPEFKQRIKQILKQREDTLNTLRMEYTVYQKQLDACTQYVRIPSHVIVHLNLSSVKYNTRNYSKSMNGMVVINVIDRLKVK